MAGFLTPAHKQRQRAQHIQPLPHLKNTATCQPLIPSNVTTSYLHWLLVSSLDLWCWHALPNLQAMVQSQTTPFCYYHPLVSLFSVMNWLVGPGCSSTCLPKREVTFSLYSQQHSHSSSSPVRWKQFPHVPLFLLMQIKLFFIQNLIAVKIFVLNSRSYFTFYDCENLTQIKQIKMLFDHFKLVSLF